MNTELKARDQAIPLILVVLVLYQLSPEESPAFQSLRQMLEEDDVAARRFHVILYDNSPMAHTRPDISFACDYFHDESNPGLAQAYQYALERAQSLSITWMLLLDQDTALDYAYLHEAIAAADEVKAKENIVAIAPKLVQNGILLSPHLPRYKYPKTAVLENAYGIQGCKVAVFNSGALLRVQAVIAIGGFPQNYPLDFLDHAVFNRLYANGGQVFILRARLAHDLSMLHFHQIRRLHKSKRFRSIYSAESRYYAEFGSSYEKFMHRLQRIKAILRMTVVGRFREAWVLLRFTFRLS